MKFDGDIIITDPCYIIKDDEDWELSNYGSNLEKINIHTFVSNCDGDCVGCDIINLTTKEKIGEFCSDSSMVSVIDLAQLMEYNPQCLKELSKDCFTIIKNFSGEVKIIELNNDNQSWAFLGEGNISFQTDWA